MGTAKVNPRGVECMMVVYTSNHADGVYKMWNPNTNRIIVSRDIIWMRRMFYNPAAVNVSLDVEVGGDDVDNDSATSGVENADDDNDKDVDEDNDADTEEDVNMDAPTRASAAVITTRSGRVVSQPQRLVQTEWAGAAIASMNLVPRNPTF